MKMLLESTTSNLLTIDIQFNKVTSTVIVFVRSRRMFRLVFPTYPHICKYFRADGTDVLYLNVIIRLFNAEYRRQSLFRIMVPLDS